MATRAERRRVQRNLNKSLGKLSREQIDKIIEERMNAQALVDETMPAFEKDVYEKYKKQYEDKIARSEAKMRKEYDMRIDRSKEEIKHEVVGDWLAMIYWVLREHFDFRKEDLHKVTLEMMRLETDMHNYEKLGRISISDILNQMKLEGYDMQEDLDLVNEIVDAELDRYDDLYGKPYVPRGSILDKWRPKEDERMKRLLASGYDFLTIGLILGRTEGACKARAKKVYGTNDVGKLKEKMRAA